MLSNSSTVTGVHPSRCAATAPASGCSESFSRAQRVSRYVSPPSVHTRSVTSGRPSVSVPVLSSTTTSTRTAVSRLSASFIRMPFSAPLPIPSMMAVGVASPRAQGQAMMSTVTSASRPCENPFSGSSSTHAANETRAMPMITGTKIPAMRSTSFCTGALLPCASCTSRMICASRVSLPTFAAVKRKLPRWLTVPANTVSPGPLAAGTGSPVSMLSST